MLTAPLLLGPLMVLTIRLMAGPSYLRPIPLLVASSRRRWTITRQRSVLCGNYFMIQWRVDILKVKSQVKRLAFSRRFYPMWHRLALWDLGIWTLIERLSAGDVTTAPPDFKKIWWSKRMTQTMSTFNVLFNTKTSRIKDDWGMLLS